MPVLAAVVVVVGIISALNLLLTFGVIRRLREHSQLIDRAMMTGISLTGLVPGDQVTSFSAADRDGNVLDGPSGLRVVGFFSSSCSACPERVGPFLDYLSNHKVEPDETLSIMVGPKDDHPPYAERLAKVGRVCTEQDDGLASQAFKVRGFPMFFLLDSGQAVVGSSYDPAALPAPSVVR
jgi:hypothetical protein